MAIRRRPLSATRVRGPSSSVFVAVRGFAATARACAPPTRVIAEIPSAEAVRNALRDAARAKLGSGAGDGADMALRERTPKARCAATRGGETVAMRNSHYTLKSSVVVD